MNLAVMRIALKFLMPVALALLAVGCAKENTTPSSGDKKSGEPQTYQVKGVVKELKPDGKTVIIKHEEVPNYMPAMTMPFEVRDRKELAGLKPADEVSFRLLVTEEDAWIEQITRLGTADPTEPPPRETFRRVRIVEPLEIGDPIPDYPFTNELGQAISLGQFKGKALGITFIFTRCPIPNFCPRMSENFAAAYKRLSETRDGPDNWHLLSVSFDPEFDSPATLKNYGSRYKRDTNRWNFATGALIEIDAITEQFGLVFPREGVNFNHNLRTVVIDAQGKVQKVFIGNEWKVDDFVAEMVEAANAK
ncbi:MAG TPA: SCO family protein [Verrucomicrobiae bacterium]|nr:SCO family protein [Verrucomicrobiae bacterium]